MKPQLGAFWSVPAPELLARLDAVTRRSLRLQSNTLRAGPLELDLSTRRVTRAGRELDLLAPLGAVLPTLFGLLLNPLALVGVVLGVVLAVSRVR